MNDHRFNESNENAQEGEHRSEPRSAVPEDTRTGSIFVVSSSSEVYVTEDTDSDGVPNLSNNAVEDETVEQAGTDGAGVASGSAAESVASSGSVFVVGSSGVSRADEGAGTADVPGGGVSGGAVSGEAETAGAEEFTSAQEVSSDGEVSSATQSDAGSVFVAGASGTQVNSASDDAVVVAPVDAAAVDEFTEVDEASVGVGDGSGVSREEYVDYRQRESERGLNEDGVHQRYENEHTEATHDEPNLTGDDAAGDAPVDAAAVDEFTEVDEASVGVGDGSGVSREEYVDYRQRESERGLNEDGVHQRYENEHTEATPTGPNFIPNTAKTESSEQAGDDVSDTGEASPRAGRHSAERVGDSSEENAESEQEQTNVIPPVADTPAAAEAPVEEVTEEETEVVDTPEGAVSESEVSESFTPAPDATTSVTEPGTDMDGGAQPQGSAVEPEAEQVQTRQAFTATAAEEPGEPAQQSAVPNPYTPPQVPSTTAAPAFAADGTAAQNTGGYSTNTQSYQAGSLGAYPQSGSAPTPPNFGSSAAPVNTRKGFSIASLVLGILSVLGGASTVVIPILAVVFGHLGLKKEPTGRPLAITGLILGYIGIALLVVGIIVGVIVGSAATRQ